MNNWVGEPLQPYCFNLVPMVVDWLSTQRLGPREPMIMAACNVVGIHMWVVRFGGRWALGE